ncbi:hypothetical protein GQF58_27305 [Escherichia coli]|nr:hypothetical protein [Escherichia coli]EFH7069595.1 hypothetical protein [Escherichia coli]MVX71209.1 hypothetical protein [Escherichia coli]MVX75780.1 hypothetical protein [Escherichia coli]MVX93379.1 hypothetical protein [Escherichia coli]
MFYLLRVQEIVRIPNFSELYAIEDEIRGLPESERLAVRQQRSKALC